MLIIASLLLLVSALAWSCMLWEKYRDHRLGLLPVFIVCMLAGQLAGFLGGPGTDATSLVPRIGGITQLSIGITGLLLIYFLSGLLREHKKITRELYKSRKKLADTVKFFPQIILESDTNGRIRYANRLGREILGEPGIEGQGPVQLMDLVIGEDRERVRTNTGKVLDGTNQTPNIYTLLKRNSDTFPALVYSDPIIIDGEVQGVRGLVVDISRLSETEGKLRKTESRLEKAQAIASIGSWEHSLTDNSVIWSREMYRIIDQDPETTTASYQAFIERMHPDDVSPVLDAYHASKEANTPMDITHRLVFDDGRIKIVRQRCEFYYDNTGIPLRSIGTVQDITGSVRIENELRKSEEKYRTLVESSPYCIHQIDTGGRLISMNRAGLHMLGLNDESDIIGAEYLGSVRIEDRERIAALMRAAFAGNPSKFEFQTEEGLTFSSNFVPVFDSNGAVDRLFGITQDISSQKQAELALQTSETRLRSIFERVAVGVALLNSKTGEVMRINKCYTDMLGYTAEELSDLQFYFNITHPDDREDESILLEKFRNNEIKLFNTDKRYIKKNGETIWVNLTVSTVENPEDGEDAYNYIAVAQDITQRKNSEDILRKLFQGMEASSSGVTITNIEGIIEYINPMFTEMTGYTKEDVIGKHISVIRSGETPQHTYSELWSTVKSGGTWKGELHSRRKDGSLFWNRVSITGVRDEGGVITHIIGNQEDVTHEYELTEQLSYQASHDSLTGLVNRYEFERRLERLLSTARHEKCQHALCFMDLDQFKVINDTCGHIAGDEMMRQLSVLLGNAVRKRDTLGRLGGDEFGVLMGYCSPDHAQKVARHLLKVLQEFQFSWEGHVFRISASVGLVSITEVFTSQTEILKQADSACYIAKELGRNRIHVYHRDDTVHAQREGEMQWVTRIYQALEQDQFRLFAQTIVPLEHHDEKHYELLLRMENEKGELIPPGVFLPAAERYNIIEQLDRWVVEKSFSLLSDSRKFLGQTKLISINLSGQSLTSTDFLGYVISRLFEANIPANKICFEITETAAISNLSAAYGFITSLRDHGCRFALDDFGSGLSSFGYLKNLPIDFLKIDGMFVKDIVDDPIDRAMVKSINEIGQVMNMQTIAEFVENDEIKGMLREIGVNYAQGYGIGKPYPFVELLGRSDNIRAISSS